MTEFLLPQRKYYLKISVHISHEYRHHVESLTASFLTESKPRAELTTGVI
jgi:hypothetical protein